MAHELNDFGQYQMKGICVAPVTWKIRIHNQSTKSSTVVSTGQAGKVIFDQSCNAIRCKYLRTFTGNSGRIA